MLALGRAAASSAALASPLLRRPLPFASLLRARVRLQRVDGPVGVDQLLAAHLAGAHRVFGRGFPFDAAHAIGNVAIALAVGPELRRLLERYDRRLRAEVVWA